MNFYPKTDLQRFEDAMLAGGMAWWEIEFPSGAVFFSENKTRMLGFEKQDFIHYSSFTDLVHPEDYEAAMQAMRDHIEGRAETYDTAYRIKCADGSYRKFKDIGKIVQRKGKEFSVAGIVIDITDN